jgi:uncharacterized protein
MAPSLPVQRGHAALPCHTRSYLIPFFCLAYGFTWLCWLPLVASAHGRALPVPDDTLATLGQFGPLLSALVWTARESGGAGVRELLGHCLLWRVRPLWFGFALLFAPCIYLCAIQSHALITATVPALPAFSFSRDAMEIVANFLFVLLVGGPLGEEPGWRGFALPRLLRRWGNERASLILALLWAGWHLPLWWVAHVPCSFGLYVVGMIPLTYLFTCLYIRTRGSVFIALLFHASLNTALIRLPIFPAWPMWTAFVWAAALLFYWSSKRDEK